MKKTRIFHNAVTLLLVLSLFLSLLPGCSRDDTAGNENDAANQAYGAASLLTDFTDRPVLCASDAREAIREVGGILGVRDSFDDFLPGTEHSYMGTNFYRFDQYYQGIPVYGRNVIVAADSGGNALTMSHNYLDLGWPDTIPEIQEEEARTAVEREYKESRVTGLGLCIYSLDDLAPTLTWQFQVSGPGLQECCFVDAIHGKIVATIPQLLYEDAWGSYAGDTDKYGNTVSIQFKTVRRDDGTYILRDEDRNITVYDAEKNEVFQDLVDENGNIYNVGNTGTWTQKNGASGTCAFVDTVTGRVAVYDAQGACITDQAYMQPCVKEGFGRQTALRPVANDSTVWENGAAARAMATVADAYDMLSQEFGRDGFNGASGHTMVCVNDSWRQGENAYSSFGGTKVYNYLCFGYKVNVCYDLVGHEYAHSIEQSISAMNGKDFEARSIQEGVSDVFGELLQDWAEDRQWDDSCDWIHVNDGEADRVIDKPESAKMPVVYQGKYYKTKLTEDSQYHNSTIISHACYRMTHPADGDILPLTNKELGTLLLYSMEFLPTNCKFADFADRVLLSAKLLGYSRNKQEAIAAAFQNANIAYRNPTSVEKLESSIAHSVAPDSQWTVLDENGSPCASFTLQIGQGLSMREFFKGKTLESAKNAAAQAYSGSAVLNLEEEHLYELVFTDSKDSARTKTITIAVLSYQGEAEVILKTDFTGMVSQNPVTGDNSLYAPAVQSAMESMQQYAANSGEKGMGYGYLADLNGDAVEELVMAYDGWDPYSLNSFRTEIWSWETGGPVLLVSTARPIYETGRLLVSSGAYTQIKQKDGVTYLYDRLYTERGFGGSYPLRYDAYWREWHNDFYELGIGVCTKTKTFYNVEVVGREVRYHINGSEVDDDVYSQQIAQSIYIFTHNERDVIDYTPGQAPGSMSLSDLLSACMGEAWEAEQKAAQSRSILDNIYAACNYDALSPELQKYCQGYWQDLDGNGEKELLVQYYDVSLLHFEVWDVDANDAALLFAIPPQPMGTFAAPSEVQLMRQGSTTYLVDYQVIRDDNCEEGTYFFYTLGNPEPKLILSYRVGAGMKAEYTVNGTNVTEEEYFSQVDGYRKYGPVFAYDYVLSGSNEVAAQAMPELIAGVSNG